jgi:uncharacterized coiled-coil protein SlyX
MTPSDPPADATERVEMKIAFLERANIELSDVVYRQQRELDELRAKVNALSARLETLKEQSTQYSLEDERPPHY